MSPRGVVALGVGQCVNWGVLYYAFTVLLVPVAAELAVDRWIVTGAFSLGLLVSAALAPRVGAWADAGHAPRLIRTGGWMAAALLGAWAMAPGLLTLYLVWAGLGVCMAMTLYEPAFALVARGFTRPAERLRALALVTVFGGLASTVFLPLTAALVAAWGWRPAVLALAALMAGASWLVRVGADEGGPPRMSADGRRQAAPGAPRLAVSSLLAVFGLASLAGSGLMSNLVPVLAERAMTPTTAALIGGLFGIMQLPGRVLLLTGALAGEPGRLVAVSLALQGAGLIALALAPSAAAATTGVVVFAAGAGLNTLIRPHLVQELFGAGLSGAVNGRIARAQQLARAAGPMALAAIAASAGYRPVLLALAAGFAASVLAIRHRR